MSKGIEEKLNQDKEIAEKYLGFLDRYNYQFNPKTGQVTISYYLMTHKNFLKDIPEANLIFSPE